MPRKKHLINVHTSTGTTAPTGASLYLGEIAVQHTPNDPALWIKVGTANTSTEYEKFIGQTEIISLIDNAELVMGSGYTYSGIPYVNSATTISDAYSAVTKILIDLSGTVEDDEYAIAAAFNDVNNRLIALSGNSFDPAPLSASVVSNQQNITALSAATTGLSGDLGELSASTTGLSGAVVAISAAMADIKVDMILGSGYTYSAIPYVNSATQIADAYSALTNEFIKTERTAAEAVNDLNNRIIELSGSTGAGAEPLSAAVISLSAAVVTISGNSGAGAEPLSAAVISLSAAVPDNSNLVHRTGTEHIGGYKHFHSGATVYGALHVDGTDSYLQNDEEEGFGWIWDTDGVTLQDYLDSNLVHKTSVEVIGGHKSFYSGASIYGELFIGGNNGVIQHGDESDFGWILDADDVPLQDYLDGITTLSAATTGLSGVVVSLSAAVPDNSNLVHISGSESITGDKTFNGTVNFDGDETYFLNTVYVRTDINFEAPQGQTPPILKNDSLSGFHWILDENDVSVQDYINSANTRITSLSAGTTAHTATTIPNGTSSQMHLPTVTSSDNGKILMVSGGTWTLTTPVSIYQGGSEPAQNLGNDGDIYLEI